MIEARNLLPAVCLDDDNYYAPEGVEAGRVYLVMGQVAQEIGERGAQPTLQGTHRVVLLDIKAGTILPGSFNPDVFRHVNEEDHLL